MFDTLLRMMSGADDLSAILPQHPHIIDVRTRGEYAAGYIAGSQNTPLDQLASLMRQYPDTSTLMVVCCASGSRSAAAKRLLMSHGYTRVYDGGSWRTLQSTLARDIR